MLIAKYALAKQKFDAMKKSDAGLESDTAAADKTKWTDIDKIIKALNEQKLDWCISELRHAVYARFSIMDTLSMSYSWLCVCNLCFRFYLWESKNGWCICTWYPAANANAAVNFPVCLTVLCVWLITVYNNFSNVLHSRHAFLYLLSINVFDSNSTSNRHPELTSISTVH